MTSTFSGPAHHSFAISPPDAPQAFFWTIAKPGQEAVPTVIDEWTDSTDAAYREARLAAPSHFYYVSPTVFPEVYVNTFGIGAPLAGLPVYAVLDLFVDIEHDRFWWWHGAALTASLLTALAALFVFLAARGFVQPMPAVLIALAFGLGSCAWPVSSQALWQHPASTFLSQPGRLVAAAPRTRRPLAAAWCGAAFGMAVLCHLTVAVVVVWTGAYLLCVRAVARHDGAQRGQVECRVSIARTRSGRNSVLRCCSACALWCILVVRQPRHSFGWGGRW